MGSPVRIGEARGRPLPTSRPQTVVVTPWVFPPRRAAAPDFAACLSDGPLRFFSTERSPRFSNECSSAANAVRCARSPSPYVSTAESCAFIHVRVAFSDARRSVEGSSLRAGIADLLRAIGTARSPARAPKPARTRCFRAALPGNPAEVRDEVHVVVPDAIQPVVGWRTWLLVETEAGYRLQSIIYPTPWPARGSLRAGCRREPSLLHRLQRRKHPAHDTISVRCTCGIYASTGPEGAAAYLDYALPFTRPCRRAIGQVALWGRVVECERGWRAERAYPLRLFLPVYTLRAAPELRRVAADLRAAYGAEVEAIEAPHRPALVTSLRDLAAEHAQAA